MTSEGEWKEIQGIKCTAVMRKEQLRRYSVAVKGPEATSIRLSLQQIRANCSPNYFRAFLRLYIHICLWPYRMYLCPDGVLLCIFESPYFFPY